MPDKRTALQKRRGLCLEIAEAVIDRYDAEPDVDECGKLVDTMLPHTYDEAIERDAKLDAEIGKNRPEPTSPSLGERLRTALGLGKEHDLKVALEAAIERIERLKQLEKP